MKPFVADIEELTEENVDYRSVIHTGAHLQLVLMTLQPGQEIGPETHASHDQFFRIEEGWGKVVIDGTDYPVLAGWGIVVPAGASHNLINTGSQRMRLYTIYAPPEHAARLVEHERPATEPTAAQSATQS
jgi:mannose-6-phosphate isomerase-like protein (cupin superfamily)